MNAQEKIAYIKGLMEGMKLDKDSDKAKLFNAIVEALDIIAEDIEEIKDDIYDLMDELDPDEILYLELQEGAADVIIDMDAYIPNPIAVCGDEEEIVKIENVLCRKVR